MKFENPYRHGAYHFTVAALIALGVNKDHKFSTFASKLRQVWAKADAEGWKAFQKRPARSSTGKDLEGRIIQNCRVLQRVRNSYGTPLLKAGAVIDLTRDKKGGLMICLNTKSKRPETPGRAPKPSKPEPKAAKAKAKSTRKPTSGKKRAQKRSVNAGGPNQRSSSQDEMTMAPTEETTTAN